jgi:hypothetical protein
MCLSFSTIFTVYHIFGEGKPGHWWNLQHCVGNTWSGYREVITCEHFPIPTSSVTYTMLEVSSMLQMSTSRYPLQVLPTQCWRFRSCYSILSVMCMYCRSLFVLLSFFFYPLCCLFFFDTRILIITLVSSNSSYQTELLIKLFFVKCDSWLTNFLILTYNLSQAI